MTSAAQTVGFALPINVVKEALDQFKTTGKFASKPYLGVEYQMISKDTAILNNVPQGAYVVNVVEGSPAASAGIQPEDIITKMAGGGLNEGNTFADVIVKKQPGEKVDLEIWRDGQTLTLSATLSEFSE